MHEIIKYFCWVIIKLITLYVEGGQDEKQHDGFSALLVLSPAQPCPANLSREPHT